MALHKNLPIYKVIFDLTGIAIALVRNMPRDIKGALGTRVLDECLSLSVLVLRANIAQDKVPYLAELIERNQLLELLFRLSHDVRAINKKQHAAVIELTAQIGKQAGGWKNASQPANVGQASLNLV